MVSYLKCIGVYPRPENFALMISPSWYNLLKANNGKDSEDRNNMFTLNDILQGNQGKVYLHSSITPDPFQVFPSAQHDSRQVSRGDLFVAIKGAQVDGHHFISEAAKAGARAALCNQPANDVPPDFLQIIVPDVIHALHTTTRVRAQRQQNTLLIGI